LAESLPTLNVADTPIQRHVKIKAAANPHDRQWESYFESRWGKKMLNSTKGRSKLYRIWVNQDGVCPTCQKPIAKNTPWGVRHIVKWTDGGSDAASNCQMYHLNCHGNREIAMKAVM